MCMANLQANPWVVGAGWWLGGWRGSVNSRKFGDLVVAAEPKVGGFYYATHRSAERGKAGSEADL